MRGIISKLPASHTKTASLAVMILTLGLTGCPEGGPPENRGQGKGPPEHAGPPDDRGNRGGNGDANTALVFPFSQDECLSTATELTGDSDQAGNFCGALFDGAFAAHNECVQIGRPIAGDNADRICDTLFTPAPIGAGPTLANASCGDGDNLAGGRSYAVFLESESREQIAFQVQEPNGGIDCDNHHPLVLHGHGYGGSRTIDGFDSYRDAGFTVISIDQRGFGESSGNVRTMDPEFEGRDLVQILDWAEENLDYLAREPKGDDPENLVVGAIGSSYGGGYQLLLTAVDPKQRLDALVPDITWHDLRYSLNPGNVPKSGWGTLLTTGGESSPAQNRHSGQHPIIRETLLRANASNRFAPGSEEFFRYHSPVYHCEGQALPSRTVDPRDDNFLIAHLLPDEEAATPSAPYPEVDMLITQGMKDTLFNFNEAWRNFQCMNRQGGGDVRLLTHESGHILPVGIADEDQPAESFPDPVGQAATVPGFQGSGGAFACGDISIREATQGWLEHKLMGAPLPASLDGTEDQVCLSLDTGDAVMVPADEVLAAERGTLLTGPGVQSRDFASDTPIPNGFTAAGAATVSPVALPLGQLGDSGAILAGIPTLELSLSDLAGRDQCEADLSATSPGCDPIVFIGLGWRPQGDGGHWRLVDDQIKPVRGLRSNHIVELVGVAERLPANAGMALLVYGFHPQYPQSFSRDALIPFVNVSGQVQLPFIEGGLR
ncbi:MAG: CocE/NonD family hydrolase [Oleiphilaceae bacterium]|nr:CocE/NonD family hydrolase [Oleiphilaceae bacterium]